VPQDSSFRRCRKVTRDFSLNSHHNKQQSSFVTQWYREILRNKSYHSLAPRNSFQHLFSHQSSSFLEMHSDLYRLMKNLKLSLSWRTWGGWREAERGFFRCKELRTATEISSAYQMFSCLTWLHFQVSYPWGCPYTMIQNCLSFSHPIIGWKAV
jgi:hypothetical protein